MYPKRLILHSDQPHKERWQRYFDDQYFSERVRLGLSYEVIHTKHEEEVKQNVLELNEPKGWPDKRTHGI